VDTKERLETPEVLHASHYIEPNGATLKEKEYYSFPTTKALLDLCRKEYYFRPPSACDRTFAHSALWEIIDECGRSRA